MRINLRDDSAASTGSNGAPALAGVIRSSVRLLNDFALRPRPVHHWIGGNDNYLEDPAWPTLNRKYITGASGAPRLSVCAIAVPVANATSVPLLGLKFYFKYAATAGSTGTWPQHQVKENINEVPAAWWPDKCFLTPSNLLMGEKDYAGGAQTARTVQIQSGSNVLLTPGPQFRSGMVMESPGGGGSREPLAYGVEALPIDGLSTGNDVLGSGLSDHRDMVALRDFIRMLWRDKRIHFGWNAIANSVTPWISFTGAARYFHDTTYGSGGTAPYYNGPGIDLPVTYAAQGRRTTVRVYMRVYARMAAGGTGTFSVYTRDTTAGTGGMTGPTALTNGVTVSGSSWQWYPNTTAFNETTDPYFLSNADPAKIPQVDNILPCGVASGGELQVAAYTLCVRPSTL